MKKNHSGLAFLAGLGIGVGLSTLVKIKVAKKKAENEICDTECDCDCECNEEEVDNSNAMKSDGLEEWGVEKDQSETPNEYDMVNEDVTEEVKEKITTPIQDEKLDGFLADAYLEKEEE